MSAEADFEQIRLQFVDPIQHDYEVIRPIVLFGETAAERSRHTGMERTGVGDKARRFVLGGMEGVPTVLAQKTTIRLQVFVFVDHIEAIFRPRLFSQ